MNVTAHSLKSKMRPEDAVMVWSITFTEDGWTRRAEVQIGWSER